MDRRSILKTAGLVVAGSILQPFGSSSQSSNTDLERSSKSKQSAPGKRRLGKTLEVSSVGLGAQNMSRTYQTTVPLRAEMHHIIRTAFDRGITFFDAAEAYGPWEVERILGEGIKPFRDKVKVATKFGWNIDQQTGRWLGGLNSQPKHIRKVVENMLERLRTDRIDLLYQHRVDPNVPIEDVVGTIQDLIREGKVLHYGLCEPGPQTVRRAHAIHPVTAIQNEYSLLWRGPEESIIPLCEELGIGLVPWSPLGVGFLTGAIDASTRFAQGDIRSNESRFSPENLPGNLALMDLLKKWGAQKRATAGQVALAWLHAKKPWIVPIPGTTQMAHMLENSGADEVKFTADELLAFNEALGKIQIKGERLPAGVLALSGVEAPMKK